MTDDFATQLRAVRDAHDKLVRHRVDTMRRAWDVLRPFACAVTFFDWYEQRRGQA